MLPQIVIASRVIKNHPGRKMDEFLLSVDVPEAQIGPFFVEVDLVQGSSAGVNIHRIIADCKRPVSLRRIPGNRTGWAAFHPEESAPKAFKKMKNWLVKTTGSANTQKWRLLLPLSTTNFPCNL